MTPGPPRRRQPLPMHEVAAQRGFLTVYWLALYARDAVFGEQLKAFATEHATTIQHILDRSPGGLPWPKLRVPNEHAELLTRYVSGLEEFVTRWQLHLLPHRRGLELVHAFCVEHVRNAIRPEDFHGLYWFSSDGWLPQVDTTLSFGTVLWDPTSESLTDARARIEAELNQRLEAELERVVQEHEQAGFVFPKTRSEHQKYLQWLYWKLVKDKSNNEIAELAGPSADLDAPDDNAFISEATVTNKTKIIADLLDINLANRHKPTT